MDGAAALEWAASYLERVGELPVLAQVRPGELSAQLPEAAPEQSESFAEVLRDLDELLLPAVTNWQSPRFFSYFAVTSSEPAILAELLAATLKGMTKALTDSREQVRQRMVEEAEALGANAIIAMRFDTSEMGGNWTEICAYGTAVRVHKV